MKVKTLAICIGLEKFSGLDKPEDNIKINLNGKIQDLSLPIYLDKIDI